MADRLKGITIEINGDTTGLSAALKGVNTQIKDTQTQLKDVNKLLKLDPTSAELLTQKHKLLKTAINDTSDKLKQLKSVQDQMDEGLKNGSVTQDQYNAWQREIVSTEVELQNLKKECINTDNAVSATLKAAGSKIQNVGSSISSVGENITKNVTGPIVAVGGASLAAFSEVDTAMDTIATKTGASGDALQEMQDVAQNIATTIPTSFETAGNAVGEVSTRFHSTGKDLNDLSTQFIKFADINKTDVSSSIDNASMIMQQFNLTASDAPGLLGQITAASQSTGVSTDTLMSSLQNNGSAMRAMGLDASQSITMLSNFSQAGIDDETALKAMSKAAQNYSKDGKDVASGMSTLIAGVKDGTISYEQLSDVVGVKNALAFQDMAKSGRLSLDNLDSSLSDYGSTVDNTFSNTQDPIDSFKTAMNSLKEVGAELGATIGTVVAPIIQKFADILKQIKEKYDALSPAQQEMIVKVALVAAAIGPVVFIIGKIVSGIGLAITALGFLLSPIGLIVVAITAVIAIGVALITHWDLVKQKAGELGAKISEVFNAIGSVISTVWNTIGTITETVWNAIKMAIEAVIQFILTSITAKFEMYRSIITTIWNAISTVTSTVWNGMQNAISNIVQSISTTVSNVFNSVKNTVTTIWNGIQTAMTAPVEAAKNVISGIIDTIKGLFNIHLSFPEITIPHISLPHFRITGSFSLDPPSVPHFGIDWYKNGGILTDPTVFGMNPYTGNAMVAGEAGPEAILPIDTLQQYIQAAMASGSSGFSQNINITSPTALTPSEIARQTRIATRDLISKIRRR